MGFFEQLKVVELASILAGPSVGQFLAELGAQVIKVENATTGGDATRSWQVKGEQPPQPGCTAYFDSVNWGKTSIGINLKAAKGQAIVHALLATADIVLTSYKPGDAGHFGLDYATLSVKYPSLIYLSITGFGEEVQRAGFDAIIQAETGFMAMNGWPGQSATKMPVALMDVLAGHQAKEGILAALLERTVTGKGRLVSVALRDAGWAALVNQGTNWLQAGHDPQRMGNEHPNIVPYGTIFTDKAGRAIMVAIGTEKQFHLLCELINRPALREDERYSSNQQRVANRTALVEELRQAFAQLDSTLFYPKAIAAGLPVGRVNTVGESLQDPAFAPLHLQAANGLSGIRQVVFTKPGKTMLPPPTMGQHTTAILQSLGYGNAVIAALRKEAVIA